MARVPQSKPSVPPRAGAIPFQRGTGSAEAFGAGEARTEEERVRAGIRISEAMKAATARVGAANIAATRRTGAARAEAVNRIGEARAGAVTRTGAARVGAAQRTGAAQVGATARTGAAESAAALEAEAITGAAISGIGRALSGVSEDIAAASARLVLQEETLERMEILGEVEVALKAAMQIEIDEGTDFRTLESLNAWAETVNGFIAGGAAKFANQTSQGQNRGFLGLEALDQTYKGIGTERAIASQRGEVERVIGERVNEAASKAEVNPAQTGDILAGLHEFITEEFGPVSTPIETAARLANSTAVVVTATVNKQLTTPSLTGENIIQVARILGAQEAKLEPDVRARLNTQLVAAVARFEGATGDKFQIVKKGEKLVDTTRLDENGQAVVIAEGVGDTQLVSPGVQVINENNEVVFENPPLPVAPKPRSGSSKQALALENINDALPAAIAGTLSPSERGQFFIDVALATAVNTLTKERIELPAFIKAGLDQLGITDEIRRDPARLEEFGKQSLQQVIGQAPAPAGGVPEVAAAPAEAPSTEAAPAAEAAQVPSEATTPAMDVAQARDNITRRIMKGIEPGFFTQDRTIFDLGSKFTGPIAAGARTLGRTPIVGPGGGEFSRVAKSIPLMFNNLVNALRENMRSEAERKNIKQLLSVDPKVFDNEKDFQIRMLGVDDGLLQVQIAAMRALEKQLSPERRAQLTDTVQLISAFRSTLIPPHFEGSLTDVEKAVVAFEKDAPEGTRYIFRIDGDKWMQKITRGPKAAQDE